MSHYLSPARLRRIGALVTEVERMRNVIAALSADLTRLDTEIERLTQDRRRGMTRGALDILRRAGQPMGIRALTVALMADKGMDAADRALVNRTMEKMRVSLTRQAAAGIVRRERGPGWTMVWSIAGLATHD
jgi:hypothetical protein